MNISCPHCGFAREVPEESVPDGATRATCPRCAQSFPMDRPAKNDGNFTLTTEPQTVACTSCQMVQPYAPRCSRCGMALALRSAVDTYAGFWLRVVASLIDGIILSAIQMVCGIFLGLTSTLVGTAGGEVEPHVLVLLLFNLMIGWAYFTVFTGASGQTPGKMALRIKVVRTDGTDLGYGKAFLREVPGKFVSKIILGIGYLMVAFTERKQGLHDMIAETYVIKL
ncbi:MAG: RDD family protein [Syntrophotaleaceae bacterium]